MRYQNVHLESFGLCIPERVVPSLELEERLAPVYERLRIHPGRIELFSGIRERRHFEPGTRPSWIATQAANEALARSNVDRNDIGCLIHSSVCRDFMEPATASVVHAALELPRSCAAYDLSNACLGFANALTLAAGMIESGELRAALVVAGEDGRPLVDETIQWLLAQEELTRNQLKLAYASLTIGSGGAACVVAHSEVASSPTRLIDSVTRAATEHNQLCQGDRTDGASGPLMSTDSEALLHAGNALAVETWAEFKRSTGWSEDSVEKVVTHQVGSAHRKLLFESLQLDLAKDFPTVETYGNVGSVSLPLSYELGRREGFLGAEDRVALLGIGSGLQCSMLALDGAR